MIITISGANFSASNIGTLSSYLVRYTGNVTGNVTSVAKNDAGTAAKNALTATITMKSGYTYNSLSVTVNGSTITGYTATDNGNGTVTLTVPANLITGTVVVAVVTTGTSVTPPVTPDPEQPGTGGGGTSYPTIDIEVGTVNAPDGQNGGTISNRWRSISYTDISNISSTICLTGCKYIISCYDSSKTYLGQKSASGATLIKGSGQWLESGTVVNISELKNNGVVFVRFVLQSGTGISIKLDGVECFGKLTESGSGSGSGSSDSTNYGDFELNYPFEYGSLVKEDGRELGISATRRVRTDFIPIETLSPNFTVKETRYLVCCYGESNNYLGQYNGTDIISGDVITAAQWLDQGVVTTTNNLVSLGVKNIRIVGETGKKLPFVYVNDIKMTKPE